MLVRCVVARPVHEFLFEPKSRSGGRSAAASDFFRKKMQKARFGTFSECAEWWELTVSQRRGSSGCPKASTASQKKTSVDVLPDRDLSCSSHQMPFPIQLSISVALSFMALFNQATGTLLVIWSWSSGQLKVCIPTLDSTDKRCLMLKRPLRLSLADNAYQRKRAHKSQEVDI